MAQEYLYAGFSVFLVSLISFVGVSVLALASAHREKYVSLFVGLAIGALIGDVMIHLMPEAYEALGLEASMLFLAGFVVFFAMERFLHWRHGHHPRERHGIQPVGIMNLAADSLHNLIDGMLIGASYLVSLPVGIATTTAVVLHEIPQEIGDFSILIHSGFRRRWAVAFNLLSALFAFIGLWVVFSFGSSTNSFTSQTIAFTSGGFVYIVAVLFRQLSKEVSASRAIGQFLMFLIGLTVMGLLVLLD